MNTAHIRSILRVFHIRMENLHRTPYLRTIVVEANEMVPEHLSAKKTIPEILPVKLIHIKPATVSLDRMIPPYRRLRLPSCTHEPLDIIRGHRRFGLLDLLNISLTLLLGIKLIVRRIKTGLHKTLINDNIPLFLYMTMK